MKSMYLLIIGLLFGPMITAQIDSNENRFKEFEEKAAIISAFNPENFVSDFEVPSFKDEVVTVEYEAIKTQENTVRFLKTMLAIGAGFGLVESETLWCLGAAYYYNLKMWQTMALYGSLGFMYSGFSNDGISQNIVDFQLQFLMFQSLRNLQEIRFIYGILLAYGIGSEKYDGFKADLSRTTIAAVLGLQLLMSPRWSLLLQSNIFAYQSLKVNPESGGDFTNNVTGLFLNKNSLLTISVLLYLGKQR